MKQITLGIAGTAKNTGKTTTTRALLEHFQGLGVTLGLTSIGYDGESVDNVTGLPKPRLYLDRGQLVAVAERCLAVSSAGVKVLERTDLITPLGRVVCGRVVKEGLLVVAGPNQIAHLGQIRRWMAGQGAGLTLVDGALNRLAPMVETDGLILATGASRSTDLDRLALEAGSLGLICSLPGDGELPAGLPAADQSVVYDHGGRVLARLPASLFDPEGLNSLGPVIPGAAGLYCPGVVSGRCLERLGELPFPAGMIFSFADPVKILLSGDLIAARSFLEKICRKGGNVVCRRPLPLLAVTVNPFYPNYRFGTHDYKPAYVDGELLLSGIRAAVGVPVFDLAREGAGGLAGVIEKLIR